MNAIFTKRHYSRAFFAIFGLVLLILFLTRAFIIPAFEPALKPSAAMLAAKVCEDVFASIVVTLGIGWLIFWLTPAVMWKTEMQVIEPKEIGPLLKDSMRKTEFWWYRGACGRFLRATTLPRVSEAARHAGLSKEINVSLLNPANERLCEEYATYRSSLRSADKGRQWTKERVKIEACATIVAVLRTKHTEPLLRIRLHVVDQFSAFRVDMSSSHAVITKEDETAPAMRCDSGTYFYLSYRDDMVLLQRQSREITPAITCPVETEGVRAFLASVFPQTSFTADEVGQIVDAALRPESPYS
jgi:hypothetical protein